MVDLIGAPFDLCGRSSGSRLGPGSLRLAGIEDALAGLGCDVQDEGEPFDLEAHVRDATDPDNMEREAGRGLFLMRALMDRVERFDANGLPHGNIVRLVLSRG